MNKQTYAIDTGDGVQLAAGISAYEIDRVAQERADRLGESVWVYAEGSDRPRAREVKPVEIEVELDSATGPRVTYGGHDIEDVEAALPEGWDVDWSSAYRISAAHTTPVRYAAALVEVEATCECGEWAEERCCATAPAGEMVLIDWMPNHLRSSHEAAGASMRVGLPGSVRARVAPSCARHMRAVDGEWCVEVSA